MTSFISMFIISFIPLWIFLHYSIFALHCLNDKNFDKKKRYKLVRMFVSAVEFGSFTKTTVFGKENLPDPQTGYFMVSNHQGKYDALAVMRAHDEPMSILMEYHLSQTPACKQVMDLSYGARIDLFKPRQQLRVIKKMGEDVKNGSHFLIFPEGGYSDNGNSVQFFHEGSLLATRYAQAPIVPICLFNTFDSLNRTKIFKIIRPEVYILPPIPYEEYKDLNLNDLAAKLRSVIIQKMKELHQEKGLVYVDRDEVAPTPPYAVLCHEKELKREAKKNKKTK